MSQLYETIIPYLWVQYMGFIESNVSSLKEWLFFYKTENPNDEDGANESSVKINE
jgi:hypothetical protein